MRKLLPLPLLLLLPAQALAEETVTPQMLCTAIGEAAHIIMVRRQEGLPMSSLMAIATDPTLQAMVRDAYAAPRMSTEKNQKKMADDFRNEMEAACYSAFN